MNAKRCSSHPVTQEIPRVLEALVPGTRDKDPVCISQYVIFYNIAASPSHSGWVGSVQAPQAPSPFCCNGGEGGSGQEQAGANQVCGQDSSTKQGGGRLSRVGDEEALASFPRTLPASREAGRGQYPCQLLVTLCVAC